MGHTSGRRVFDYRLLRLVVGLIALSLPIVVSILASEPLESISAAYHQGGRNALVGMLFAVGALMLAYNGHSDRESAASKTAAVAAILVAVVPTTCKSCSPEPNSSATVHYIAATVLFFILGYFCLGPFRSKIKGLNDATKKTRRSAIYLVCGSLIFASMAIMGLAMKLLDEAIYADLRITYYGETVALLAFGVAWIVAGKAIPFLVDEEDRLHLSWR